ncbi:CPBP family intramembrane glutamic endopeptidase [Brevibacterium aurantiacum]|nr:type II CAAX endopeptidase family protein [Brevibacterium aurantiacum]
MTEYSPGDADRTTKEPSPRHTAPRPNPDRAVPERVSAAGVAPGWRELVVAVLAYLATYGLVFLLLPLIADDAVTGVVGLFVSGAIGIVAFLAACLVRRRRLSIFGIRRARPRFLWMGVGFGLAAYLLGVVAAFVYIAATGDAQNVQTSYQSAARGSAGFLVLTLVAGSIVTPIGEELMFRGVVANVLFARLTAWVAVPLSALIFAVAHGINPVFPVAFVVGVLAALLFKWSGSIWPGVILHGVNNATALVVPLAISSLV